MTSLNSPKEQAYINTTAEYARIALQGTGQDSEAAIILLPQEAKSAYDRINERQIKVTALSAQLNAATDRATTAERAVTDNPVAGVQRDIRADIENGRLQAEASRLNALSGNERGWKPGFGGCMKGISDVDLKELVDFANNFTGASPALQANIKRLIDQQGKSCEGAKKASGAGCEIDFDEYIRLFDDTIRNSLKLQDQIVDLKAQIRSGAAGSLYGGDDQVRVNAEIKRLAGLLTEANARISGPGVTALDSEGLKKGLEVAKNYKNALDKANSNIEQLDAEVNIAQTETRMLQKQLEERVAKDPSTIGPRHSSTEQENARLTHALAAAERRNELLAAEVEMAQAASGDLPAELAKRVADSSLMPGSDNKEIVRLNEHIATLDEQANTLNDESSAAYDKINELKHEPTDAQTKQLKKDLADCRENVRRLEQNQVDPDQDGLEALPQQVEDLQRQVKELTRERNQAEDERDKLTQLNEDQAAEADAEQGRLQALLDECNKGRDQADKKADAVKESASASGDVAKLKKEIRELKKERDGLQGQVEIAEQNPNEAASTNKDLQNQMKELNKKLTKAKRDIKKSENQFDNAEVEVDRLQGELEKSNTIVLRIRGERTAAREERDALRIRVQTAEESQRAHSQTAGENQADIVGDLRAQLEDAKRNTRAAEAAQTNILAQNRELKIERDEARARARANGPAATNDFIEKDPSYAGGEAAETNGDDGRKNDLRSQIHDLQAQLAAQQLRLDAIDAENATLTSENADLDALLENLKTRLNQCLQGHPDYDDNELIKALEESDRARERRENNTRNRNDTSQSLVQDLQTANLEIHRLTEEVEKLTAGSIREQEDKIAELKTQLETLSGNMSAEERAAHVVDTSALQQRIRELEELVKALQQQIEDLKMENAGLKSDLNQVKADLLDKIVGAVDHLRKEEIDKIAVDAAASKGDNVVDDDDNVVDPADPNAEESSDESETSVVRSPAPLPAPKTKGTRGQVKKVATKTATKTATKAAVAKKTKASAKALQPAKGKKATKAIEEEEEESESEEEEEEEESEEEEQVVGKRVTRSSAGKRKSTSQQPGSKNTGPKDKKRKT